MSRMQDTLERLRQIRELKGRPDPCKNPEEPQRVTEGDAGRNGESAREDWRTLLRDMWDRLETIYELEDLARLKQDEAYYAKLMELEHEMEAAILEGRGYRGCIERYERHFAKGLERLRTEGAINEKGETRDD